MSSFQAYSKGMQLYAYMSFPMFSPIIDHCKVLNTAPYTIQQVLAVH